MSLEKIYQIERWILKDYLSGQKFIPYILNRTICALLKIEFRIAFE